MKEYLLSCIDRTFDDEDYYKINKYIEKLEEEIKRQSKAQVILDDELADLIDYKSRIDKAIEYIENNSLYEEEYDYDYEENSYLIGTDDETAKKELLAILQGENK